MKLFFKRLASLFGTPDSPPPPPAKDTRKTYPYKIQVRWPGYPIIKMKCNAPTAKEAEEAALVQIVKKLQITAKLYD
jgi:hypothetical protein